MNYNPFNKLTKLKPKKYVSHKTKLYSFIMTFALLFLYQTMTRIFVSRVFSRRSFFKPIFSINIHIKFWEKIKIKNCIPTMLFCGRLMSPSATLQLDHPLDSILILTPFRAEKGRIFPFTRAKFSRYHILFIYNQDM